MEIIVFKDHIGIISDKRNKKVVISSESVEWICKNFLKQKYVELLEKYKIELTQLYLKAGYPYDNFFIKNKKNIDSKTNV